MSQAIKRFGQAELIQDRMRKNGTIPLAASLIIEVLDTITELASEIRAKTEITVDGRKYIKVPQNNVIKEGAVHSWDSNIPIPIANSDGKTVGGTPEEFSARRKFYNPVVDQ